MIHTGLTSAEVQQKTSNGESNRVTTHKSKTIGTIIIENVLSVFNLIILLVILFLFYFYIRTGDSRLILDTIGAATTALLNLLVAIYQEVKAKRALDSVNLLLKKKIKVIRDSVEVEIDQEDAVKGDTIVLGRGDQIIVDGKVLESNHLEIDESLLTGESHPVFKNDNDEVLSGSFCLSGNGYYLAEKVGDDSFAESITSTAKKYKFGKTPLQKKIDMIVKIMFVISIILVLAEVLQNQQFLREINIDFIRRLATIMLSLIPQGLILITSVSFALGVARISKLGAIIQKLNAIESFSNIQIVCMDKTGTLTQNKLTVRDIRNLSGLPEEELQMLMGTYAKFSSDKNATLKTLEKFSPYTNASLTDEMPFSSENKMSLLQLKIDDKERTFILGGYDVLIDKLDTADKNNTSGIFSQNKLGIYRNLLFGEVTGMNSLKDGLKDKTIKPLSLISISDEIRNDVMQAITLFRNNGVKFKILSGDAPEAVQAVVKEIGWEIGDDQLITGTQLDKVSDQDFYDCITNKSIFARLRPDNKLRIIKAFREHKNYTAMIGDGVNDLPAIKEADMGIAMEEGSSITKEIADIVLLQNKFSLLPSIFDEGNKIINSVSAIAKLYLTKNLIVIFITVLSILFSLDFPITPRRISLLNIFAIGLPSFLIALRNTNVEKNLKFTRDLISFVFVSAVFITFTSYMGRLLFAKVYGINDKQELQMLMITLFIITTITNFLAIVLNRKDGGKKAYIMYAAILITVYLFLGFTSFHFIVTDILKDFYEIYYLQPKYIPLILVTGFVSSVCLFLLQKARLRFMNKY